MKTNVLMALLMVQVLFGFWHVVGSAVLQHMEPSALIGFRVFLSAPILLLLAKAWKRPLPSLRDAGHILVLGLFIIPGNQILYAEGLQRAGPINASVLLLLAPVFTLILALLLRNESFSWPRSIGIVMALVGALGLAELNQFEWVHEKTLGNLLLIGAATCYAVYLVLARDLFLRIGFLAGVGWVFLAGAFLSFPWTGPAVASVGWTALPESVLWMLLFVILGPTLGTYGLNAYALQRAPSSMVGVFITLQPVIAISAAWFFLDMKPSANALLWGIPIIAGVAISSLNPGKRSEPPDASPPEEAVATLE
jgi:drug/metabolite transporter (DMT)-like permease